MRKPWIVIFLASVQGCGMMGVTRQVVVPPTTVDDYRSPAWIIHNVPTGARMPSEDPND